MIWEADPVYVVWRLPDGRWAAQGQKNWPLPAISRAAGVTPAEAIAAWDRMHTAAISLAAAMSRRDFNDNMRRTHYVIYNGVARTLCGQAAERRRRTDSAQDVTCATCIQVAGGPGAASYDDAHRPEATRALERFAAAWKQAHA